nr:MAG TPA: hypothetical protein [Caudoviricetes sp.]
MSIVLGRFFFTRPSLVRILFIGSGGSFFYY